MRISDWSSDVCSSDRATGITIGGEPLTPNSPRTLTGETQIALGGGVLVIRPPATAASAEARLAELLERQELELAGWDVAGLAAARTRNDTARDAQGTVQLLERSEERRVGKECVRTSRYRWWQSH